MSNPSEGSVLLPVLLLAIVAFAIVASTCCRTTTAPLEPLIMRGE
jgi:hypothetical protein